MRLAETLRPAIALALAGAAALGLLALSRLEAALAYADQHTAFVVGAAGIAGAALATAGALAALMRRG
jgi:hypothetical protein